MEKCFLVESTHQVEFCVIFMGLHGLFFQNCLLQVLIVKLAKDNKHAILAIILQLPISVPPMLFSIHTHQYFVYTDMKYLGLRSMPRSLTYIPITMSY